MTDNGISTTYNYERNRDDPHRFNSNGEPNNLYLKGERDYIGIASAQGYDILMAARQHLGSTYWATANTVTIDTGWVALEGRWKCNVFVYDVVSPIKTIPTFLPDSWPPRVEHWYYQNPMYPISNWTLYSGSTRAEPGVVVAYLKSSDDRHCGITDYDGAWINAGGHHVNRYPHTSNDKYQPAIFRK